MKNLQPYLAKEKTIHIIREFFIKQKFHEVMVPLLNPALPLEPNLYSFATDWNYLDKTKKFYLPTSPESALKKQLAKGFEQVFSLASTFRNQEDQDVEHNPEFLMLEWYRTNAHYHHIMTDLEELVAFLYQKMYPTQAQEKDLTLIYDGKTINLAKPWPRVSLAELFEQEVGEPLANYLTLIELKKLASKKGFVTDNATWEELFNQFFLEFLEKKLGTDPVFLIDFPSRISPLCAPRKDKPQYAQRFEFYLAGMELANGNTEQTDAQLVRQKFEQEQLYRQKNNFPSHEIDQEFLSALATMNSTGQTYAGVGLGVERLAMIFANITNIQEFII